MSSRRRRRKTTEEKSVSLLSFVAEEEVKPTKTAPAVPETGEVEKREMTPTTITTTVSTSEESMILNYLRLSRRVTKKELINWAKLRRIPLNKVFSIISRLEKEGKLVKRLSEGGELVYEVHGA